MPHTLAILHGREHMLVLTDEQRSLLKRPLGVLIPDVKITAERVRAETAQSGLIVTVGDATTARFAELGIEVGIEIIDGKERRAVRDLPRSNAVTSLSCASAPGEISDEAVRSVRAAFQSPMPVRIRVDGEEDLFVLLVCDACPDGTAVAYGQPGEGIVIIRIDATARDKARDIINSMRHKDDETVAG